MLDHLVAVAREFMEGAPIIAIDEYGSGNVNDTFLVTAGPEGNKKIILQRVNQRVFCHPVLIMRNMRTISEHVRLRLKCQPRGGRRWEFPSICTARDGKDYFTDPHGSFWRAMGFIDGAASCETISDARQARESGYALGRFHSLVSDLNPEMLFDTLKGFHVTPGYLRHYDRVLAGAGAHGGSADLHYCCKFVEDRRAWAAVLEHAKDQKELHLRPIHGDPKVSNIMFDKGTGQAVGIVDLDTVKPGLIHYDLGDCLRSCCNPAGEEARELEGVYFDTDLCKAVLEGYFPEARGFLTASDCAYLYEGVRLIAFELGLRFLTDYLEGDPYFKAMYEGHNLARAIVQFRLTESIESRERDIRTIVNDLCGAH